MGSKKPKVPVTDYTMSVHYGICLGPIDALLEVHTGEKLAWEGSLTTESDVLIRKLDLYGGPEREGGVEGIMHYLPGGADQILPDNIASKFGLTGATAPGFRGVSTIFFHGGIGLEEEGGIDPTILLWLTGINVFSALGAGSKPNGVKGKPGFYWQSNNPTLKTIWVRARRAAKGLLVGNSTIETVVGRENSNSDNEAKTFYPTNPAHIIYEALTNTDFGMGASPSSIDTDSFLAAAEILYDERFGLSMLWVQQDTIENFVAEVLDHIQATLYVNPKTGLITIKLLRDDYVAEEARLFTPDNCVIQKFGRKGEGEIINEMTVTYTNPFNGEDVTYSQQNIAGIAAAGAIIADSRNYYGIIDPDLAAFITNRDLRSAGIPLAKCEMVTSRDGWDLVPGDVLRLTYPEHGLDEVVFRVGAINYGRSKDASIRVTLTEDVFGYDPGNYFAPTYTSWRDTSRNPDALDFERIMTLPYYFARQIDDIESPTAFVAALGASFNVDAWGFDLLVETTQTDGTLSYELSGLKSISGRAELSRTLAQEATTLEDIDDLFNNETINSDVVAGGFLLVGDADEDQEIIYVRRPSSNSGGLYVLDRGMLDTTPKEWPVNTPVWFLDPTVTFYDDTDFAAGSTQNFKFLTRTSLGRLEEDQAAIVSATISERPHLPLRPANVQVNGDGWGDFDNPVDVSDDSNSGASTLTVTWARRNRDTEDATLLRWIDGDVTPPAGVTTTITVLSLDGLTTWFTQDGEAGTSYNLSASEFDGPVGIVRVTAKDGDGNESLQGHEIVVRVRDGGFGFNFGQNFGGA